MNSQLLPSVAARELQTRRTIRRSLTEWCRLCGFEPAAHHRIIIEELEAVARGECDRLAIFLPPVYGASDYAVSAGKGDYTVHLVVGVDADQRMYLLDLWRRQATSDEWVESLCDLIWMWRPAAWAEEQGQI